jgi:hypothetical protein
MKRLLLATAAILTLAAFQSCSKCGHCHTEATYTNGGITTTQKAEGAVSCGNSSNESGSYAKAAELDCKAWASRQTPQKGVTFSSSWVADK